jgi:hypothetical protein
MGAIGGDRYVGFDAVVAAGFGGMDVRRNLQSRRRVQAAGGNRHALAIDILKEKTRAARDAKSAT